MSRDEGTGRRLQDLKQALDADELRPDDGRTDWGPLRPRIRELRDSLAAGLDEARAGSAEDRAAVAELVGPVVALLEVSGDRPAAAALLLAAVPLAPDPEVRLLWTEGERYLPAFADLQRARYHQRRGEKQEAARVAASLDSHPAEPLARAARAITGRAAPAAAARAGRRTPRKAAFYRDRGFWTTVAVVGGLSAAFVGISRLQRPDRKVLEEIAALRPPASSLTAEAREQRISQLEELIAREANRGRVDRETLAAGAVAMIEVMAAAPRGSNAEVLGILARLRALPVGARTDAMLDRVAALVRGEIAAMKLASPGEAEAALRLWSSARGIDARRSSPLAAVEDDVRGRLADRLLAEGWAADAFLQHAARRHAGAPSRAGQALRALPATPSPWLALAPQIDEWLGRARGTSREDVAHARARLAAARQHAKERAAAAQGGTPSLEGLELPALDALRKRFPGDHEVAIACAEARRGQGDVAGAIADLQALGPVGHLVRPAQDLLADLLERTGKTAEAEALLDRLFALDFPGYQEARDRYDAAVDAREDRLRAQGFEAARIEKELLDDSALRKLREEMKARSTAVDVALRLGMLRLGRAMDESGEARRKTLARAEQDFLAVGAHAGGSVRYHLGLGQVYHRMGKPEAGDRELAAVLEERDPRLDLSVVRVYRDLGLIPRATELATAVQGRASPEIAQEAALVLSLMADRRADQERWLRKADQDRPAVRARLRDLEGDRLFERGDLAAADQKYAEVLKVWLAEAETDSAAANNAALAATWRYRCTGDAHQLDSALQLFDTSVRLAPSNAISAGNAAPHFLHRGHLGVLQRWIDVAPLRLSGGHARVLISALLRGPLRGEVLRGLKASADGRRALSLYRRQQLLAPRAVDGYEGQQDWYRDLGDEEGLRALQGQLANTTLEVAQAKAAHERRATDEEHAEVEAARRGLRLVLDGIERKLPRPEASVRAKRAHGAVWFLRGLEASDDPDEAQAAFDAFVRARALWPELVVVHLSDAAFTLALDEAAKAHPPLGARWPRERSSADADLFVYDLVRAGEPATLQALRKSPALQALAAQRRDQLAVDPGMKRVAAQLADWSIGRLLDDEGLVAAGVEHARWPVVQANAEINAVFFPYSDRIKRWSRALQEIAASR